MLLVVCSVVSIPTSRVLRSRLLIALLNVRVTVDFEFGVSVGLVCVSSPISLERLIIDVLIILNEEIRHATCLLWLVIESNWRFLG